MQGSDYERKIWSRILSFVVLWAKMFSKVVNFCGKSTETKQQNR